MSTQPQTPDLAAIKERQQQAWSSGDYGKPALRCSSWASCCAKPLICAPAGGCWTWRRATATRLLPPLAASAR